MHRLYSQRFGSVTEVIGKAGQQLKRIADQLEKNDLKRSRVEAAEIEKKIIVVVQIDGEYELLYYRQYEGDLATWLKSATRGDLFGPIINEDNEGAEGWETALGSDLSSMTEADHCVVYHFADVGV